jgi:hypothetical protein
MMSRPSKRKNTRHNLGTFVSTIHFQLGFHIVCENAAFLTYWKSIVHYNTLHKALFHLKTNHLLLAREYSTFGDLERHDRGMVTMHKRHVYYAIQESVEFIKYRYGKEVAENEG